MINRVIVIKFIELLNLLNFSRIACSKNDSKNE
jgi:hypothetical protein